MKHRCNLLWLLAALLAGSLGSCSHESEDDQQEPTVRTVLVYMPWTGTANSLLAEFRNNIADIKQAVATTGLQHERVVVMLAETASTARLFELADSSGTCVERPLLTYDHPSFTTTSGIAAILSDVRRLAPAESYAMLIGGHGMGWVRTATCSAPASEAAARAAQATNTGRRRLTRYFGSTEAAYQTDIETLAEALQTSGMEMEYILFDDCYMANVETAYCLKDVARYLVASTCEVMRYGLPYERVLPYLLGTPIYNKVCEETVAFYQSYTVGGTAYPYATLSVTDCSQLDNLATVMRRVNSAHPYDASKTDMTAVQPLDGYATTTGTLFHDLGSYARTLCGDDAVLAAQVEAQLARTVTAKAHTDYFFCNDLAWQSGDGRVRLAEYSGLTISDASTNPYARDRNTTAWWRATH